MFAKKSPEIQPEQAAVKAFLMQSKEFINMKQSAERMQEEGFINFVERLEKCKTFGDLVYQCNAKYNIANNDNIVIYNLGRNKVNALLFAGGFFSNRFNFNYYGLHFYESILAHLKSQAEMVNKPK